MKLLILVPFVALLGSCVGGSAKIDDKVITVGASSTPHARILEQTKSFIESKGYSLDIRVMDDYVTPNISLNDGDLDANYFQHEPYLADFNENHHTDLVSVAKIHFEPMTIFQGKNPFSYKIIIPNDKSNGDRAKDLLEKEQEKLMVNLAGYTLVEAEASTIPMLLQDVSYVVCNGNYALASGLYETEVAVASESTEDEIAQRLANVIAVRKGNEAKPAIKVLVDALKQDNVKSYISDTFHGAVIPMF